MTAQRLGTILLFVGVSAWLVYFGIGIFSDVERPIGLFLAWHLLGVIPGMILRGSKVLRWLGEKLRGASQPAGPEG
jgi:hypothetical protein